jgi:poly(hydroxyalkanoate) depolymerase family esterase
MKKLPSEMLEAMRLTRSGRLAEATALIQRLLSGEHQQPARPSEQQAKLVPPILDLVAEVVTGEVSESGSSNAETEPTHGRRAEPAEQKPHHIDFRRTGEFGRTSRKGAARDLAPARGHYLEEKFSNGAGTRSYKLYIPSGANLGPRPLIVMLHGCTQSADDFAAGTRMNFAAEDNDCFVTYPEQVPGANPSKCWNWFQTDHQVRDRGEPSIVAGIAKHIMGRHNIDPRRVYVAGLSAGGAAAAVVAQAYPDVFAALGVHSGLACGIARDLPSAMVAMQGRHSPYAPGQSKPLATIIFHGDQDKTVHPRNAADVAKGAAAGEAYEHEIEQGSVPLGRRFTRSLLRDRSGKTIIEDWVIHGAGHAWSGGSKAGSFTDPLGPDATKEMLRFFLEHERSL